MGVSLDAFICYGFEVVEHHISPDVYEFYGVDPCNGIEYLLEAFNLDLGFSSYGVDFEGTIVHSDRIGMGRLQTLDPTKLVPSGDADELLRNFCDLADIPQRKPKWMLCAYYA